MKTFLLCLLAIVASSCNQVAKLTGDGPYVEINGNDLTIKEFAWGYGTVRVNQFSGDFEKVDKRVYDQLKGKSDAYNVHISNTNQDKYGNTEEKTELIGVINATELNRYKDWSYWHQSGGIKTLLFKKLFADTITAVQTPVRPRISTESDANEFTDSLGAHGQVFRIQYKNNIKTVSKIKTFKLTVDDLYPDPATQAGIGYQGLTPQNRGVIKAADFYHGTLEVKCDNGEYLALRIEPENLSTFKKSDLRYFMKPGFLIEFICDLAGAKELIIIDATFSE